MPGEAGSLHRRRDESENDAAPYSAARARRGLLSTPPLRTSSWRGNQLDGPSIAKKLIQELRAGGFDPDVIILDSFPRFLHGSETPSVILPQSVKADSVMTE
jgi:hypothetical protein